MARVTDHAARRTKERLGISKDGQILMQTTDESRRYSPHIEAQLQEAGYVIYVDGKRLKKKQRRE